ncbi:MAG: TonB-dependent receptor [Chitinophagaceae bacterium]|nr:TonB-dependent receptor [Chitinophagaceae bacterium]MCB9044911.1 TonB-dependent receptor [Chitinophagales bacterium]
MAYRSLVLFLSCFLTITTYAQNNTVKGVVSAGKNKPVPYATVTLLQQDSSVINGTITDDDGKFELTQVRDGDFLLRVSGIGITTKTIAGVNVSGGAVKNMGNLQVRTTSQMLKEVEISGARPMMEMGIDKKVFNVDKNITSVGGSAGDVLQNVPSVSVDVDGGVSLRGKSNVTILIDGKPATLLGGDDATALQSLPASSIDQVEVITNPSAKYDASGMTGIINIITKREKKFGTNGSVTLGAGTRDKYNGSLNLNMKNEKWNVFLNSSFRQNRRYRRNTTTREDKYDNGLSESYEDNLHIFNGFFNTLGAEYNIDTNNSITLKQNINKMYWGGKGNSDFSTYASENDLLLKRLRDFESGGGPLSSSSSLEYKHKFKKKERELSGSSTFARSWMTRKQIYTTNVYDQQDVLVSGPIHQDAPGTSNNSSLNTQVDYVSPMFTKNGKLEAGLKSQLFWLQSSNTPTTDSAGNGTKVDSVLLNGYDYTQQIYAAYLSWGDQVGKFRYKAGLRSEYAYYEGTATSVQGKRYSNEFLNLFPSLFFSYELKKDQSVYLSYTRRIDRPRFYHLLPYVDLSNPQDTSVGNPALIPEFIHNIELNYNKLFEQGHNIIISTYYQYTQNLISQYRVLYGDGTSYTQRRNLNAGVTYGLELTGQIQLVKKLWDMTLNTNFFRNEILGSNIDPTLDNSGFSWFGKVNTTVKLPKEFSLQVNGNYESPKVVAQGFRQEVYWIDVALRKNLFKGKANLVLNVSDIFNTRKYTTNFDFGQYLQTNYNDRETRIGNINFTYRFGSSENKGFGMKKKNGRSKKAEVKPDTEKDHDNIKEKEDDAGGF